MSRETDVVILELNSSIRRHLDKFLATGLYGQTIEQVIENLISSQIRIEYSGSGVEWLSE